MVDQIIKESKPKMQASIDKLHDDLSKIRTGRASAAVLDGIKVSVYGSLMTLKEVASITVPESNQLYIKPWDRSVISAIETSIRNSDIGLSPINDGTAVRLILPPMTEERRKEIVGQAKRIGEESKVALRNVRSESWSKIQAAEKSGEATEDDKYRGEEELNKLIGEMNREVERIVAEKETEILKI